MRLLFRLDVELEDQRRERRDLGGDGRRRRARTRVVVVVIIVVSAVITSVIVIVVSAVITSVVAVVVAVDVVQVVQIVVVARHRTAARRGGRGVARLSGRAVCLGRNGEQRRPLSVLDVRNDVVEGLDEPAVARRECTTP